MEFSKRFTVEDVWSADLIAKKPELAGKTLCDVLFKNGQVNMYPLSETHKKYDNHVSKDFGFYVKKGKGVEFYGKKAGRAWIFVLPYEPAAESPDEEYPFWLSNRSGAGALALRFHDTTGTRAISRGPGCALSYASR